MFDFDADKERQRREPGKFGQSRGQREYRAKVIFRIRELGRSFRRSRRHDRRQQLYRDAVRQADTVGGAAIWKVVEEEFGVSQEPKEAVTSV